MFICRADINYKVQVLTLQELQTPYCFNMYLVNSKCITFLDLYSLFPDYLCKCSNSGVVGFVYIDVY